MMLVNKVAWWVKTDDDWPNSWSKKALRRTQGILEEYQQRVVMTIHQGAQIKELFWPIYQQEIMSKTDYYLTDDYVQQSFQRMEQNEEYRLLWFKTREGEAIGGNIVRLTDGLAKGVFRAYSHEIQQRLMLADFDYYADYRVQEYVRGSGYKNFSRGSLTHPCTNIGTILFKLKTGCYPKLPLDYTITDVSQAQIDKIVSEAGACALYSQADEAKRLGELRLLYKEGYNEVLIKSVTKLSERIGIKVSIQQL